MGCDISGCIEIKVGDSWLTYRVLDIPRDYNLFRLITDCGRGPSEFTPLVPHRGVPDDMSEVGRILYTHYQRGGSVHSITWLSVEEMDCIEKRYETILQADGEFCPHPARPWGYLFQNDWSVHSYPESVTDCRVVLWFNG